MMTEFIDQRCLEPILPSEMLVVVRDVKTQCPDIREITFVGATVNSLPNFIPGSHIAVEWARGQRNCYSLTGNGVNPDVYSISVLLDHLGAGGSRCMHQLQCGQHLVISRPRSAFSPVADATQHLLIAGGIGVTPILSHARAAAKWNRSFQIFYAAKRGRGAHIDDLRRLGRERLTLSSDRADLLLELDTALQTQPIGTHLYVCGPIPMIEAVLATAHEAGWTNERLHSEPFAAPRPTGGEPFAAKLTRSGMIVSVDEETTLLEALLKKGLKVPNLCRQGVCGECKLRVKSGSIDHRDLYLSEEEKEEGKCMMPCVSRAHSDLLELNL